MSIYLLNYIFEYTNLSSFHCELQVTWYVFTDKAFTTLKLFCNLYTLVLFFRYPGWMFSEIFWISNYVYFKGIIHFVHYFFLYTLKIFCVYKNICQHNYLSIWSNKSIKEVIFVFFLFLFTSTFCHWFQRFGSFLTLRKNMIHVYTLYSQACTWCFLLKITYRKYPFLSNT